MRTKAWLALALSGALTGGVAIATTLEQLDLDTMIAESSVAVIGQVQSTQTATFDDNTYTVATVAVREALWGTTDSTVTVNVPGGSRQLGKIRVGTVVPGAPLMLEGSEFLLLLTEDVEYGGYQIVGFAQGAIPVAPDQTITLDGSRAAMTRPEAVRELRDRRERRNAAPAGDAPVVR